MLRQPMGRKVADDQPRRHFKRQGHAVNQMHQAGDEDGRHQQVPRFMAETMVAIGMAVARAFLGPRTATQLIAKGSKLLTPTRWTHLLL
jgi:hypothetical protein